ncbi:hypothetical protein [Polaribacter sp. L3A8]|uniref:hypothetical protein n=1 Tax=Polaribacter sp. L3A8 TaxID=2686361 RepID=UPI00131D770A|nr:hypothetical protein [Polaribacter sp. L3A8]
MTHLVALDHSLEHHSNHKEDVSFSSEFPKVSNLSQSCSICDIYLHIVLSKESTFTYTLLTTNLIIEDVFEKGNNFRSVIFKLTKSRAPPTFIA